MTLISANKFFDQAKPLLHKFGIEAKREDIFAKIAQLALKQQFREEFYTTPFPPLAGTGIGYVSDHLDTSYTVRAGLTQIRLINRLWLAHRNQKQVHRVLDFGCGSGRLLRYPNEFGENIELHGCEVNPKAVDWLNKNFNCRVHLIEKQYDLSFVDGQLDLIYCWSIFTHFSEEAHKLWLDAMFKKLNSDGILIVTFKTTEMIERLRHDEAYRKKNRAQKIDLDLLQAAGNSGFAYFECYEPEKSSDHGIDAATFGQTYISHQYIQKNWSKFGKVLHLGVAAKGWQDIAVIKKL